MISNFTLQGKSDQIVFVFLQFAFPVTYGINIRCLLQYPLMLPFG